MKRLVVAVLLGSALGLPVAAGTAIAATSHVVTCGDTISTPGQYNLTADCSGAGITIAASNVHLKLNGYTMTGNSSSDGIFAQHVSNLDIQGPGTITGYYAGVELNFVDNSHVHGVTASHSTWLEFALYTDSNDQFVSNVSTESAGHGFSLNAGHGDQFVNNVVTGNAGNGIYLYSTNGNRVDNNILKGNGGNGIQVTLANDNHLDGNQSTNNGLDGIFIDNGSNGNYVDGNTATGNNPRFDLVDLNAACGSNKWDGNHFGTAYQSCIG